MHMKRHFWMIFPAILVFALACSLQSGGRQPARKSMDVAMLEPGDKMGEMVITTGASRAAQLWTFCTPPVENAWPAHVECEIPLLNRLAIGYTFGAADSPLSELDWSALTWELTLDDRPIDLKAFGTYDFALPEMAKSPSHIREVFRRVRTWDVVLENLTPGVHTLRGLVQLEAATYQWTATLTVLPDHNQ